MSKTGKSHSQVVRYFCLYKDSGVASVALRSLAIAAECLKTRREQEEVLEIFNKIRQETGWRVGFLNTELKEKWGWNTQHQQQQPQQSQIQRPEQSADVHAQNGDLAYHQQNVQQQLQPIMPPTSLPSAPPVQARRPPVGIPNPLLATADFNMPQHPYQSYYVAPNPMHQAPSSLGNHVNPLGNHQVYY